MLRNIRPLPISVPGLNVVTYASTSYFPVGISNDRTTLYARGLTAGSVPYMRALYQSVDDGVTWTLALSSINLFGTSGEIIQSVVETDDGEIIINVQGASSSPGRLWKSTGWATSHTTATFTNPLTSIGGYFDGRWSVHCGTFGNDLIAAGTSAVGVVCEYGAATSVASTDPTFAANETGKARRVYYTSDYGATWTQILDLALYFPSGVPLHCHAAAYDPYWDRIWLTWGDTQSNTVGGNNMELLFSDDRGVTWSAVAVQNGADAGQSTALAIRSDSIILGSDNRPGIVRIARAGYRTIGAITYPATMSPGTGAYLIANGAHQNRKQAGAPLLMAFQGTGSIYYASLYYTPDGVTFSELWLDDSLAGGKLTNAFGPTLNGFIVGVTVAGFILRGQIEEPGRDLLTAKLSATGDGTTTVFTFPHFFDKTPTSIYAWDTRATAGTYTITADATNFTVTFTTAPANTVKVILDVRFS